MQDLPPRSQSAMQTRSPPSFQFKASRLFQKVIRLGNPSRKSHADPIANHPYNAGRHTPHSRIAAKPFMSQPLLPLAHRPMNRTSAQGNGRTSSSSQSMSSSNSSPEPPLAKPAAPTQNQSLAANTTTTPLSVAVGNPSVLEKVGVPSQSHMLLASSNQIPSAALQTSDNSRHNDPNLRHARTGEKTANEIPVDGLLTGPNIPHQPSETERQALSATQSKQPAEATLNHQANAIPVSSSTFNQRMVSPDPTSSSWHTLRPSTSTSVLSTRTTSSTVTITPHNYRSSETEHVIPPVPPIPKPGGTLATSSNGRASEPPSFPPTPISSISTPPQTPSTIYPQKPFTLPKFTPGHTRFSLTDGDLARLSPSIIIRQPAWPILHLPTSGATLLDRPATSPGNMLPTRPGTARLRHMPALTMDGNGQPEEADEEDLVDESESSDDGEDGGDDDGYESARSSTSADTISGSQTSTKPSQAPPVPAKDRDMSTPNPSASRTPRFGQLGSAAHDYFSGVFSPTPSASSKTPKVKASFYATPASTPFSQPTLTTPSTNPPILPPMFATPPLSFPHFSLSPPTSGFNKRGSRSMFDLSHSLLEGGGDGILDNVGEIARKPSINKLDEVPVEEPHETAPSSTVPIQTPEDRQNSTPTFSSLKRRRSMPLFTPSSPPPPYPTFLHHPPQSLCAVLHPPPSSSSLDPPTDPDPPPPLHYEIPEGKEELPGYSNSIYIRSVMPRKMEFSQPQVPAKDRKWRRVVCELEGTAFRVYEYRQKGNAVKGWWERKVGVGDVSKGVGIGGGTGGNVTSTSVGNTGLSAQVSAGNGEELSEEERARRRRMQKIDVNEGRGEERVQETLEVNIPASPPRGRLDATEKHPKHSRSKSRFSNFLKPGKATKSHSRSNSDVTRGQIQNGSETLSTRSSLNSPRPSVQSSRSEEISEVPRDRLTHTTSRQSLTGSPLATRPAAITSASEPTHSISTSSTSSLSSTTPSPNTQDCPLPTPEDLKRVYSLQNAESGLGNDYIKRKNVIRVRMQGEQFLLQAKDVAEVVEWIEGLHSAANIALDLDERPMPRGPLFPRRRRRRRRAVEDGQGNGDNTNENLSSANGGGERRSYS